MIGIWGLLCELRVGIIDIGDIEVLGWWLVFGC